MDKEIYLNTFKYDPINLNDIRILRGEEEVIVNHAQVFKHVSTKYS